MPRSHFHKRWGLGEAGKQEACFWKKSRPAFKSI